MCAPNTNKHKQTQITHIRVWFVFLPPTHARLQIPATNTYVFATFSEQRQLRLLVYTPNTYAFVPFSQNIFLLVQSDPGPSFMVLFTQYACVVVGFALQTHVLLHLQSSPNLLHQLQKLPCYKNTYFAMLKPKNVPNTTKNHQIYTSTF